VAGAVEEGGIGASGTAGELADPLLEAVAVEIEAGDHLEAEPAERSTHRAGVVARVPQGRGVAVGPVADHERHPPGRPSLAGGEREQHRDEQAEKGEPGAAHGRSPAEPGAKGPMPALRGPDPRVVRGQPEPRRGEAGTDLLGQEAGAVALAAREAGLGGAEEPLHAEPFRGRAEHRRGTGKGASIGETAPLRLEETGGGCGRPTVAGGALGPGRVAAELLEFPVGATALDRGGGRWVALGPVQRVDRSVADVAAERAAALQARMSRWRRIAGEREERHGGARCRGRPRAARPMGAGQGMPAARARSGVRPDRGGDRRMRHRLRALLATAILLDAGTASAGWQEDPAVELRAAEGRSVAYPSRVVERLVDGRQVVVTEAHCRDGRAFDASRTDPEMPFELEECRPAKRVRACRGLTPAGGRGSPRPRR